VFFFAGPNEYHTLLKDYPREIRHHLKVFTGHIRLDDAVYKSVDEPFLHFTILRNPIDRLVSHYYYILGREDHKQNDAVIKGKITLAQYATGEKISAPKNIMTRYLSGSSELDGQALNEAKNNLKNLFTFFGFQDKFDESLMLLKNASELQNPFYLKKNETKKRKPVQAIPEETLQIIAENNQLDIQLFEYALALYQERMQSLPSSFFRETERFKNLNRSFQNLVEEFNTGVNSEQPFFLNTVYDNQDLREIQCH